MRTMICLLGMSLLMLIGCTAADSTSTTVEATAANAARNIAIEGAGVQLVALKMPGMT